LQRSLFRTLLALALVAVAACGGDDDDAASSETTEAPAAAEGFPVTVDHAFGKTTIDAAPELVVSVGLTEQDVLLALGVTPVAVTDWYGDQPHATWPWAQDELGDATPEVLTTTDGFQLERIAALEPDLIIGTNAGITEESYEQLSAIAPTIAHAAGAEGYFSAWDEQTLTIGRALGMDDEAEELVAGIEEQFEAAAAANPEFDGVPIIFLQNAFYDGEAIAYQEGLSTQFLTDLGFVIPSELDAFVGEAEGSQAFIPLEQLSVLDTGDVLLWATENEEDVAALEAEPLYRNLAAVQDGSQVFTDGLTAGAIYFTSVLSLPYVLDTLVPALATAVAGDGPATAAGGS
jgi:iron complex transport system substrate-binding protein